MACTFTIHLIGLALTLLAQQPATAPEFGEVPDRDSWIGGSVAHVQHEFTVPAIPGGRSDEPLDLGELPVKPRERK